MHRLLPLALLALLLTGWLPGGRAAAAILGDASIPYSAQRTVTVNGHSYAGPVYHMPGHERHEQDLQGIHQVVILDAQKLRGWLVLPGLKTYVEFPFPKLLAELNEDSVRHSAVGEEDVDGVRTTKYRVDHTTEDGTRAQGFVWLSRAGVLMKLDGTVLRPNAGKPMTIHMELSEFHQAPQDPSLFELPAGFVKLPADALGPLLGGKPG